MVTKFAASAALICNNTKHVHELFWLRV